MTIVGIVLLGIAFARTALWFLSRENDDEEQTFHNLGRTMDYVLIYPLVAFALSLFVHKIANPVADMIFWILLAVTVASTISAFVGGVFANKFYTWLAENIARWGFAFIILALLAQQQTIAKYFIAETGIVVLGLAFIMAILTILLVIVSFGIGLGNRFNEKVKLDPVLDDYNWLNAARHALILILPLLTYAALLLIGAQWYGEYSISYVSSVSANAQPESLKITALWGGQAGSLLFYGWLLCLFSVLAVVMSWKRHHRLMGWTMIVFAITLAFFTMISTFYENPFERTWMSPHGSSQTVETALFQPEGKVVAYPWRAQSQTSAETYTDFSISDTEAPTFGGAVFLQSISRYDGQGLNSLLRHWGMVIHPPLLYLGFTGFVVPFAFAMASLISGQMEAIWIRTVRSWTLVAWGFLSVGLVLGGRWAYDVLGWGGYWGWDPVENSAFLPWLTGTAFLHSVMIQEKRGMLKGWNMLMIILTYLLVVFGTVATRTGLLSSVHTFAQSPLAVPMGIFLISIMSISLILFLWRGSQGYFAAEHEIEGFFSREGLFLLNNWVFLALAVVVFWGTWIEKFTDLLVSAGVRESVINLGPEWYERFTPPLFLIIFILMGVAPMVAWRRATAKRVGKAIRIPIILTIIAMAVIIVRGINFSDGISYDGHDVAALIGFSIMIFAGLATLVEIYKGISARHRAHGENYVHATWKLFGRDRRRYGGYLIHLGVVILGIGVIDSTLSQQVTNIALYPGQQVTLNDYTLYYDEITFETVGDKTSVTAESRLYKNCEGACTEDNFVRKLEPRRDFFESGSPMSIAGTHSTLEADFYALLTFWEGNRASFRIYYNPLVNFVWLGGVMMLIGSLFTAFPELETKQVRSRQAKQRYTTVHAGASAGD